MRPLVLLAVAPLAGLSACSGIGQDAPLRACQNFVKASIATPSTYRFVSSDRYDTRVRGRSIQVVSVTYDAANQFGAMIRDSETCRFEMTDGRAVGLEYWAGDDNDLRDRIQRQNRDLSRVAGLSRSECCLSDELEAIYQSDLEAEVQNLAR